MINGVAGSFVRLEALGDHFPLADVLETVAHACHRHAVHLAHAEQNVTLAKKWMALAEKIKALVAEAEGL